MGPRLGVLAVRLVLRRTGADTDDFEKLDSRRSGGSVVRAPDAGLKPSLGVGASKTGAVSRGCEG